MQPHTLLLETSNASALRELIGLAQRLGVKVIDTSTPTARPDVAERARLFRSLFGAWQSEESGEELNRQLREARQSNRPDIEL